MTAYSKGNVLCHIRVYLLHHWSNVIKDTLLQSHFEIICYSLPYPLKGETMALKRYLFTNERQEVRE